jgi:hydroxymethylbilane synthase
MGLMVKRRRTNKISIGTRGSKLALWQAECIKSLLIKYHTGLEVHLVKIKTTGDMILDVPLAQVGGKGLFVKEIEESMLRNDIDIAVHSMKDVPADFPHGLHLAAICKREDPRDAFISTIQNSKPKFQNLKELPVGATLGTSSLRRSCQLSHLRPDLTILQLRGNLDTRIRKLDEGQFDAIILATAGVKRLGLQDRITEILPFEISLPAVGQGAIGIECRIDDEVINNIVGVLDHKETSVAVRAERAFLKRLEGGCQVPIAAYARIERRAEGKEQRAQNDSSLVTRHSLLIMDGLVGSIDGKKLVRGHIEGRHEDNELLGTKLAEDLLARGAKEILAEVYGRYEL